MTQPLPPQPQHGEPGWDVWLTAVIDDLRTRMADDFMARLAQVEARQSAIEMNDDDLTTRVATLEARPSGALPFVLLDGTIDCSVDGRGYNGVYTYNYGDENLVDLTTTPGHIDCGTGTYSVAVKVSTTDPTASVATVGGIFGTASPIGLYSYQTASISGLLPFVSPSWFYVDPGVTPGDGMTATVSVALVKLV